MLSVPELVRNVLLQDQSWREVAPGGVVVGPVEAAQVNNAAVAIIPVGQARNERYLPLVRQIVGIRCVAPTVAKAEAVATWVSRSLHERRRMVVRQPSDGKSYLTHYMTVTGGPNLITGPVQDSWEIGLTVEVLAGTEAVS